MCKDRVWALALEVKCHGLVKKTTLVQRYSCALKTNELPKSWHHGPNIQKPAILSCAQKQPKNGKFPSVAFPLPAPWKNIWVSKDLGPHSGKHPALCLLFMSQKGHLSSSSSLLNSKHILCVVSMSAAAVAGICQARAVSPSILVFGMGGYIFYQTHGVKLDNNTHLKPLLLIYKFQGLTIRNIHIY